MIPPPGEASSGGTVAPLTSPLREGGEVPSTSVTEQPMELIAETFDGLEYLVEPQTGKIFKRSDGHEIDDDELDLQDLSLAGQKMSDGTISWYSESDLVFINKKN
jgi:hypothetical protein